MTTINAIANRIGLRAEVVMVNNNPNMPDFEGDHWKVTLRRNGPRRSMTVPFSRGYAISREHDGKEVLSCLLSDAISIQGCDFEDWCCELGFDSDSRKAHRSYKATERQSAKLRRFLGEDLYEVLMEDGFQD